MKNAVPQRPHRVLVVDDDEHTRNLMRDVCEASGYRVTVAQDGEEALAVLAQGDVALVLLDVMLPRRDGFEVLRAIRRMEGGARVAIILVTAMGALDGKIRAMELGADDFVTKPFRLMELQTRIHCALQARESQERFAAEEGARRAPRAVDPLTGAGTWADLKATLDAEVTVALGGGRPVSVLLLRFDDFHAVRYRLGHEPLDTFLAAFARQVMEELRDKGRLFRLEADAFITVLPGMDLVLAREFAERVGARVWSLSIPSRKGPVSLEVRIAGASCPHPSVHTSEGLLREAQRVYQSLRSAGPGARLFAA